MKIAVSAFRPNLESEMGAQFERCPYFVFVDPDSMEFEAFHNLAAQVPGGAGMQAVRLIVNKGAKVVITTTIGYSAFQSLSAEGIKILTGVRGQIRKVIEEYKVGNLRANSQFAPSWGVTLGRRRGVGLITGRGM